MASTATSTSKVCVQCGRDVTGAQRMRDSQGRYWCIACGESDQRKRKATATVTCAGCSKPFPSSAITTVNMLPYCAKCGKSAKKRKSENRESIFARLMESSDQIDKKRLVMMLVLLGVLALVSLYLWI